MVICGNRGNLQSLGLSKNGGRPILMEPTGKSEQTMRFWGTPFSDEPVVIPQAFGSMWGFICLVKTHWFIVGFAIWIKHKEDAEKRGWSNESGTWGPPKVCPKMGCALIQGLPGLVNVYIAMERSTIFHGKTHYRLPFSIAMLNYQRVIIIFPMNNGSWGMPVHIFSDLPGRMISFQWDFQGGWNMLKL